MENSAVEVRNICKKFKKNIVLKNITFTVNKGEILGILGKNGAGKSTLIRIICDLISPTCGEIIIDGKSNYKTKSLEKIGVLLEGGKNIYHYLTVEENIYYFSHLNKIPEIEIENRKNELLDMFELKDKAKEVVSKLSRGMQQKVSLMVLLLKNPDILILDEPTFGLDLLTIIQFKNFLLDLAKKINKTIILCSHDVKFIMDLCDRILILKDGEIIYNNDKQSIINNCSSSYSVYLDNIDKLKLQKYEYEILQNGTYRITVYNLKDIINDFSDNEIIRIEQDKSDVEVVIKKIYEEG